MPQFQNPQGKPEELSRDQLIRDVAWLMEELASLKYMIGTIPYSERPMGQESVLDMLSKIGRASDTFFRPVICAICKGGEVIETGLSMKFESVFQNQENIQAEPDVLLDQLIEKRRILVDRLKQCDAKALGRTVQFKEGEMPVSQFLLMMAFFDRRQLKLIAERVLAMEGNRQTTS
jgi:hypothetical protein